jgi:hypothetical protein
MERIQRVIELCKSVDTKGLDPFTVNVDDIIATLKTCFPTCESPEELNLDAEAIQHLASVIQNQGNWVKHRSTSLYTDPFLLEEKIRTLTKDELAQRFMAAWNPIIELEQLSLPTIAQAYMYWQELVPADQRWQNEMPMQVETGETTLEELRQQNILVEKTFFERLEGFWEELKQKVGDQTKILYWDFVGAQTYSETVSRAYMTSFLVTYGYATLELVPLEEEIYLIPFQKQKTELSEKQVVSVPISVGYQEWSRWKGETQL